MKSLRQLLTKKAMLPLLVLLTILMLPTLTFADCTKTSPIDASRLSSLPMLDIIDCPWDKKTIDTPIADAKVPQETSLFATLLNTATTMSFSRNTFTPKAAVADSIKVNTPKTVQELLSQCRHRIVDAFLTSGDSKLDLSKLRMTEINHEVLSLEYDGWMDVIDIRGDYTAQVSEGKTITEYPVNFQIGIYFQQPFTSCDNMNVSLQ